VLRIGSLIVGHWFFAADEESAQKKVAEYRFSFSYETSLVICPIILNILDERFRCLFLSPNGIALFAYKQIKMGQPL